MQSDESAHLRFATHAEVFLQTEWLEFKSKGDSSLPNGWIRLTTLYDVGFLRTDSGTDIRAMRVRGATASLSLYKMDKKTLVRPFDCFNDALAILAVRPGDIIPGHNCHGFTFAFSAYWINNDQIDSILDGDGYRECAQSQGQILVFRQQGAVVHSVLIDRSQGLFIGKAGVRGLIITNSIEDASQSNGFDSYNFYRKDGLTNRVTE